VASLQALYQQALTTAHDIREHLETLYHLARECRHVTEMGTRQGWSTRAFLYAQPEVLVCYDRVRLPDVDLLEEAAGRAGRPRFRFHQADVLRVQIETTDLLFIDTWHVYEQLQQELALHASRVRRYLVLHDTMTYGEVGEAPGYRGLLPAIEEFLLDHYEWTESAQWATGNGLTLLTRYGGF
jgi:hypothetical protein